jgi:hypothetical protein
MSRWLFLFTFIIPLSLNALPSKGASVFTNTMGLNLNGFFMGQTNLSLTVGTFYGLSPLVSSSSVYGAYPNFELKIPMSITNNANDADSNVQILVEFLSNNAGYSGSNWNYSLEVSSVTQGTNYSIPTASFGEGAIFNFNLVVYIPLVCLESSSGFLRVTAFTASNSNHIAAQYTGYNGLPYGGNASSSKVVQISISLPNQIVNLYAEDDIDRINLFNGLSGLRRSQNSFFVEFVNSPIDLNSVRLWYALDSIADGNIGPNTADNFISMKSITPKKYSGLIQEEMLKQGKILSFIFEIDGIAYLTNWTYKLLDLGAQDKYQSVLMHNIISYKTVDNILIKLPGILVGKEGKVNIYSISGDLVKVLLSGKADAQIIKWDGKDKAGTWVSKGMYFIVIDFADVKEVRKTYVK